MKNELSVKEQKEKLNVLNNFKISNDLVRVIGLINYTKMELRLFCYCVSMIKIDSPLQNEYQINFKDFKDFVDLKGDSYTKIKRAFYNLETKAIWYSFKDKPKEECLIIAFNKVHLNKGSSVATFKFSEDMERMIFVKRDYILTMLSNILILTKEETQVLYLYLRSYLSKGKTDRIDYLKLKPMFTKKDSYKNLYDWKRRVLNPAIKEINKYTDILVDYEEYGYNQEEKYFIFNVKLNNDSNSKLIIDKSKKKKTKENGAYQPIKNEIPLNTFYKKKKISAERKLDRDDDIERVFQNNAEDIMNGKFK